jgi:hypothetical protein
MTIRDKYAPELGFIICPILTNYTIGDILLGQAITLLQSDPNERGSSSSEDADCFIVEQMATV